MGINRILKKISEVSKDNKNAANMLKDIYMYQRSSDSGNYKAMYREIIEKYACKEGEK